MRDFDCIEPAFTEDKFAEVKKKIVSSENINKIEVLKARRTSEEEFAAKVYEEKK